MLEIRKLKVSLLCMVLFVFFIAGCENIAGLKKIKRMEIGKPAPDFVLQDVSGKT
jgi:hypothetical protein